MIAGNSMASTELKVKMRRPHEQQNIFINSHKKRIFIKSGRRSGKTVGLGILAITRFLAGRRVLYAAPTATQTDAFWFEIERALAEPIAHKVFKVDQSERFVEVPGTKQRIKAKTAWNANTLRGDYADDLFLDEFQLMNEDTWGEVGAPMLVDNNGDAVFCFTPPSLVSTGISKARDPRHATKAYNLAKIDTTGTWECIHFTSHENPYISKEGLLLVARDMSLESYRREILAEDDDIQQSWLVYSAFNEMVCKIPRFEIPKGWLWYTGHDFGSANPAALFAALDPSTRSLYIAHEYAPGAGKSTAQHVEEFKRVTQDRNVIKRIGGNQTTEDEIRQGYTAHGWPIVAPNIGKVNAQIDRVIGMMQLNKIFIFNDMLGLMSEIANCMWVLSEGNVVTDKIKDEARYHRLACLRYLCTDFTPETAQAESLFTVIEAD